MIHVKRICLLYTSAVPDFQFPHDYQALQTDITFKMCIRDRYDIRVKADIPPGHVYTGNFSRATKPDMILEIIGKPFEIKFSIE